MLMRFSGSGFRFHHTAVKSGQNWPTSEDRHFNSPHYPLRTLRKHSVCSNLIDLILLNVQTHINGLLSVSTITNTTAKGCLLTDRWSTSAQYNKSSFTGDQYWFTDFTGLRVMSNQPRLESTCCWSELMVPLHQWMGEGPVCPYKVNYNNDSHNRVHSRR